MANIVAVPVDHQPDFGERWAGIPVDHDPFAEPTAQDMASGGQYALMAAQLRRIADQRNQPAINPEYGATFGTATPQEQGATPPNFLDRGVASAIRGAVAIPQRAIEAADRYSRGEGYDPGPVLDAAMLPMGTGAIAGVPVRAGEAVLGAGPIRAYHGSPHDFDKFSLSHIGTGEGAQAYGHGLYFAENEGTAKAYRDQLSGKPVTLPSDVDSPLFKPALREAIAKNSMQVAGRDVELAKKQLTDQINQYPQGSNARADYEAALDMLHENPHKFDGRMYEVNINADPEHFLDWDKPLSEQTPHVQELIKKQMPYVEQSPFVSGSGQQLYKEASTLARTKLGNFSNVENAAEGLRQAGIPGIKYLDQGSRSAGEGSRNYVVFDDKLVDIMRKYGLAGLSPAGLAAAHAALNGGDQSQ